MSEVNKAKGANWRDSNNNYHRQGAVFDFSNRYKIKTATSTLLSSHSNLPVRSYQPLLAYAAGGPQLRWPAVE